MKKELTNKLLEYVDKTIQFGIDQIPDILQQYLEMCFYSHLINVSIFIFMIIVITYLLFLSYKLKDSAYFDYFEEQIGISVFAYCVIIVFLFYNIKQAIFIKYTPKAYLLDKLIDSRKN